MESITGLSVTDNMPLKKRNARAVILNISVAASVLILLLAAYQFIFIKSEDSFMFGYKPYIVAGDSMNPTIKKYALVLIKQIGYEDIVAGDIIAFKAEQMGGVTALHRVTDIYPDGFETTGDAVEITDWIHVTHENYLGREIWHTNITASLYHMAQSPRNILFGILFMLSLAIIVRLCGVIVRNKKRQRAAAPNTDE